MVSGRYRYELDGAEAPVREQFVVVGEGDATRVSSWREAGDVRIDVEASWSDGLMRALVTWRSPALHRQRRYAADATTSLFPLMRVFAGPVLLAAAEATQVGDDGAPTGGRRVLVPDVRDPGDLDGLLEPLVDVRTAVPVPTRAGAPLPDGAVRLEYRGGSYAETGALFDVDAGGLLLGYRWEQPGAGAWEVRLTDLDGTPPQPLRWGRR